MEGIILIISIIAAIAIWQGIMNVRNQLDKGRKAQNDLENTRSELYDLRKQRDTLKKQYQEELQNLTVKLKEQHSKIEELNSTIQRNHEEYEKAIEEKDRLYGKVKKNSNESVDYIASVMADHLTLQYEISAEYLENKKHPAKKEAERIRELKEKTKAIVEEDKKVQYKYDFLLELFPDLELYVDDIESINELSKLNNLDELEENVDRTQYFLTEEEYQGLSETERNQLALDRYRYANKTKWQIGRDYELYIGYLYSKAGWYVDYFGIDKQLEDMGRDLIATKEGITHVIQCKYWAQRKLIHEKHIAQLYGTTVQYRLGRDSQPLFDYYGENVIPVFATNISLSKTAKAFADYLGVNLLDNYEMQEFPRIKCNINQDEEESETRIYHLPMDQQYDTTKIEKPGEFFAFTVEEAVNAGFRRAWRWRGND